MEKDICGCGEKKAGEGCRACGVDLMLYPYWCPTCELRVVEKRCSHCGMKARKVRS